MVFHRIVRSENKKKLFIGISAGVALLAAGLIGVAVGRSESDHVQYTAAQIDEIVAHAAHGGMLVDRVLPGPKGSGVTLAVVRSHGKYVVWITNTKKPLIFVGPAFNQQGKNISASAYKHLVLHAASTPKALPFISTDSARSAKKLPPLANTTPLPPVTQNQAPQTASPPVSAPGQSIVPPQQSVYAPTQPAPMQPPMQPVVPTSPASTATQPPPPTSGPGSVVPTQKMDEVNEADGFIWSSSTQKADPSRPQIVMFLDPNCPYCNREYEAMAPAVEAGAFDVRIIPVGYLKRSSTEKAAWILGSKNQQAALAKNEAKFNLAAEEGAGKLSANKTLIQHVFSNTKLLAAFSVNGQTLSTPTILIPFKGEWVEAQGAVPLSTILNLLGKQMVPITAKPYSPARVPSAPVSQPTTNQSKP